MNRRIVIKLGGASLQNKNTLHELILLLRGLKKENADIIVVHGGGPAINEALAARKIQWKFINGLRQTTPEMMGVIDDVLANKINGEIVRALNKAKISAQGVSAAKDKILFCAASDPNLLQVGKVESVSLGSVEKCLASGKIPIVAPIGYGVDEIKYNINADWAAAKIAIEFKADDLIFLTDQDGILDEQKKLLAKVTTTDVAKLIETQVISGGMMTKVNTMMAALNGGVKQVRVLNAAQAGLFISQSELGTVLTGPVTNKNKESVKWNHPT